MRQESVKALVHFMPKCIKVFFVLLIIEMAAMGLLLPAINALAYFIFIISTMLIIAAIIVLSLSFRKFTKIYAKTEYYDKYCDKGKDYLNSHNL